MVLGRRLSKVMFVVPATLFSRGGMRLVSREKMSFSGDEYREDAMAEYSVSQGAKGGKRGDLALCHVNGGELTFWLRASKNKKKGTFKADN